MAQSKTDALVAISRQPRLSVTVDALIDARLTTLLGGGFSHESSHSTLQNLDHCLKPKYLVVLKQLVKKYKKVNFHINRASIDIHGQELTEDEIAKIAFAILSV